MGFSTTTSVTRTTSAIASITAPDQPEFTMLVGADEEGQLLEIGVSNLRSV